MENETAQMQEKGHNLISKAKHGRVRGGTAGGGREGSSPNDAPEDRVLVVQVLARLVGDEKL